MAERDGKPVDDTDPLAPATEEELALARRLRDALDDPSIPSDEAELARALHAAWAPGALAADELEAIVAAAVTPGVRAEADALAAALDGGPPETPEAELALALRAAWSPRALDARENAELVARAVGDASAPAARAPAAPPASRRGVVVRVAFGAAVSALALAASLVLYLDTRGGETPAAPLARARSTQPLFSEPFRPGEASARIDRIALARSGDLRDNRFARWGVR